jgi:hypothetical protein
VYHFYLKPLSDGAAGALPNTSDEGRQKIAHVLPVFRRCMCFFAEYFSPLDMSEGNMSYDQFRSKLLTLGKHRSVQPLVGVSPAPSRRALPANSKSHMNSPSRFGMIKFLSLLSKKFPSLSTLIKHYNSDDVSTSSYPSDLQPPSKVFRSYPATFANFLFNHVNSFVEQSKKQYRKCLDIIPHYFCKSVITGEGRISPASPLPLVGSPDLLVYNQVFVYDPPRVANSGINMAILSDHLLYDSNIVDEEIIYKLHYNICYALVASYFGSIIACSSFGDVWLMQGLSDVFFFFFFFFCFLFLSFFFF